MDCPRCSHPLRGIDLAQFDGEYAAVVIDLCSECGGVWLDKGELDHRDESVWTDAEALDFEVVSADRPPVRCPKCAEPMTVIAPAEAPAIQLDRCPKCLGFWMDAGEVEAVQRLGAELDSATLDHMTLVQRPPDWFWLRWALHLIGQYYSRRE